MIRNRWKNVLKMASSMNIMVTHIFREGNQVADLLEKHGLSIASLDSWFDAPVFILDSLNHNKLGRPCFRLSSS
jgi:hypothetical protein